ncbi:glycoside hydrolase family 10 protein [Armillaria fumosa]|nr:glycoside hydrolase family 10 protein [Armillaria fumosa]
MLFTLSGLNTEFTAGGKLFWSAAADQNTIQFPTSLAANEAILESEFRPVTPENSMKVDRFIWTNRILRRLSFPISGTLPKVPKERSLSQVWHSQLPSWVSDITDADTLANQSHASIIATFQGINPQTSVIQTHIANVAGKHSDKLYAVRVPPLAPLTSCDPYCPANSPLLKSFITTAFKAARAADSTRYRLYINDYNLDFNNTKVQGMVALVKWINADEQLIDGIDTQMHLSAGGSSGVAVTLTALAGAGTDVAITELDIAGASASDYTTVVDACLSNTACVSITSCGVSDVNSWRASSTSLLFDSSYRPKDAYTAVIFDLS